MDVVLVCLKTKFPWDGFLSHTLQFMLAMLSFITYIYIYLIAFSQLLVFLLTDYLLLNKLNALIWL